MHSVKGVNSSNGSMRCGVPAIAIYKCVCPKVNKSVQKRYVCFIVYQLGSWYGRELVLVRYDQPYDVVNIAVNIDHVPSYVKCALSTTKGFPGCP